MSTMKTRVKGQGTKLFNFICPILTHLYLSPYVPLKDLNEFIYSRVKPKQ